MQINSEQINHQPTVLFSKNKSASITNHQRDLSEAKSASVITPAKTNIVGDACFDPLLELVRPLVAG
jgi:hypothetical protein